MTPDQRDRAREEAHPDDALPPAAHLVAAWDALPEGDPWKRGLAAASDLASANKCDDCGRVLDEWEGGLCATCAQDRDMRAEEQGREWYS